MASPPRATGKAAQSSENLPRDPRQPDDIRRELAELASTFCAETSSDALCLFLQIHRCIFERIDVSPLPQMVALNPLFASKFLSVCKKFQSGDEFDEGPRLWRRALDYYMQHRDQIVRALVLMAEAHILEDLADALYELEVQTGVLIDQKEFQAALDAIIACLGELNRTVSDTESVVDFLWFNLAFHFRVIEKVQNIKVAQLRHAAWEEYQRRRRFASMQRKKKRP